MDPNSGRLYPSREIAIKAGVENPIEISGLREDVERVSNAVARLHDKEQKRAKNKAAKKARRAAR